MTECDRCGDAEAVPGKLGDRCRECIGELLEADDDRRADHRLAEAKPATQPGGDGDE